jgi:hypothetical protein
MGARPHRRGRFIADLLRRPDRLRVNGHMATFTAFAEDDLRTPAGERSFTRGQRYLDAVTDLEVTADGVTVPLRLPEPAEAARKAGRWATERPPALEVLRDDTPARMTGPCWSTH